MGGMVAVAMVATGIEVVAILVAARWRLRLRWIWQRGCEMDSGGNGVSAGNCTIPMLLYLY
ncbi:hypothetical protein ABES25_17040, partial [Bacillus gobiensis]